MEYLIIGGAFLVLFFLFTGNPATSARVHEDLINVTDEFLDREIARLGRWFKHHNEGPQSFRSKAKESGTTEKYRRYAERIREEQSRRAFARSIISDIPELKLLGGFAYQNLLNDGIMATAWKMKQREKPDHEIMSWIKSELDLEVEEVGSRDGAPWLPVQAPVDQEPTQEQSAQPEPYSRNPRKPLRSASDIIQEFGLTHEDFSLRFSSYKFSLGLSNAASNWNDDIDDFSRSIGALSEEEITLAKTDFERAILNRIIVRNVSQQSASASD